MRGLTEKQRGVLAYLTDGFYSAPALAARTAHQLRAIHQHLDALEKKGLVTSCTERRADGVIRRIARITADGIIALAVQP